MKLNKTHLKKLIARELNNFISEQMAGMAGGGSVVETDRTVMQSAIAALKDDGSGLGDKLQELYDRLVENNSI